MTLPGMPAEPPRGPLKPRKVGVQANRIRTTRLCERCTEEIHRFGHAVDLYPRVARWRVSDGEVVQRLCEMHKNLRCDGG